MRIDSSGNVGIGTTAAFTNGSGLEIQRNGIATLRLEDEGSSGKAFEIYSDDGTGYNINGLGSGMPMIFSTVGSENMRIDVSGEMRLGSTTDFGGRFLAHEDRADHRSIVAHASSTSFADIVIQSSCSRNTANATYRLYEGQRRSVAVVFSVNDAGNVQNTNNSFTGLSDQRLKTNIADASSQWDDIKALKVRTYQWGMGNTGHTQLGVISQEVEAAGMNGLVEESSADEYHIAYDSSLEGEKIKSVKYSVLYMKAVKALQEAMIKIESLEARVTTLEG